MKKMPKKANSIQQHIGDIMKPPKGPRTGRYIPWSVYDEIASMAFLKINQEKSNVVRSAMKVPENIYPDLRQVMALKRQSCQELVLALLLQELIRLAEQGYYRPINEELQPRQ